MPLFKIDTAADTFGARRLKLAAFYAFGDSWNNGWGHAIDDFGTGRGDLQDDEFHFSISRAPWD